MANENVKIIIQEVNETQPRGSGVSSDVAYVPGLATTGTKNIPVLCSTIDEFISNFGSAPYKFTAEDVENTTYKHNYKVGDYDRSYIYAKELINAGISVIYENIAQEAINPSYIEDTEEVDDSIEDEAREITESFNSKIDYLYQNLIGAFEVLKDKNEFTVKYITSGGYPTFGVKSEDAMGSSVSSAWAEKMLEVAETRGDAVALIDHAYDLDQDLIGDNSLYVNVQTWASGQSNGEYGAMFTPYGEYSCTTAPSTATLQIMPASFGYLLSLANAIKTSPNWLAIAGVTRGTVPNLRSLQTKGLLSNVIAEQFQPKYGTEGNTISINAITNVKPYGLTIWGNRTLERVDPKGTTALNFLNTRNMISDIKKLAYNTAKTLMFEQDSDTLWLRFKSGVSPLLDQLKSGYGISNYKIIKGTTKYDGSALTRGEMAAVIKIYPLYAIEYFEITVVIADEDVSVS